jgi:aerobic-type carbon monoxide dehydrogenase small subunit (CoxS/CutS family)
MEQTIRFRLNGHPVSVTAEGDRALLWVLRADLGLTGTKYGCGRSQCGTCTVVIDNEAVLSCAYPVRNVEGKDVLTIEGLAAGGNLHPLQKAFVEHGAVQCGFCTPGMILRSYSLLLRNPQPGREEIVRTMETHLCRCGSYGRILDAIEAAAAEQRKGVV